MFDRGTPSVRQWRARTRWSAPFGLAGASVLLIVVFVLGLLASSSSATMGLAAPSATGQASSAYIGIWTDSIANQTQFDQIGPGWARAVARWSTVEPADNTYDLNGLDANVNAASGGGQRQVLVMLRNNPAWAATSRCKVSTDAERAKLVEIVTVLVNRYKDRVKYWQFYNEMDNTSEAFDQAYDLGGCFGTASGDVATQDGRDTYARMLETVGAAVHAADPTAKVVSGAVVSGGFVGTCPPGNPNCIFDGDFAKGVLAKLKADGMLDRLDIMATHYFSSQEPLFHTYGPDLLGRLNKLRQDMRDGGLSDSQLKPIIVDEGSYTGTVGTSMASPTDAFNVAQRDYVVKALSRAASADVLAYFWLWFRDAAPGGLGGDNAYGLLTVDGTPKPSFYAAKYFLALVDRKERLVGRLTPANTKLEGYELLTADGRHIQVIWNEADTESVAYSPPGIVLSVADATGGNVAFLHDTVTVGAEPRYIVYTPVVATSTPTATVTPPVTLTPAPTQTVAPGVTPSPTPLPVSCSPRPPVSVSVNPAGADRLQVTVTVSGENNRVVALQFGTVTNGQVNVASNTTVTVPGTTAEVTFAVRRASAGAVTVPLTVVDRCGSWQTFVGGGTSAF